MTPTTDLPVPLRRIWIFGGSGSGKSTLARAVGARTGLPVVHIDPIYWKPGWEVRAPDEVTRMIHDAITAAQWVFEGNHSKTMEDRAARADLIVYLDMPRWLRLWRFTARSIRYRGQSRPDMAEGCDEKWDPVFVRDYIWRYQRTHRPAQIARLDRWTAQGRQVVWLRSRRQVAQFLADLDAGRYHAAHD